MSSYPTCRHCRIRLYGHDKINDFCCRKCYRGMVADQLGLSRLEYLRGEIRAEEISYGELAELQSLVDEIEPGDVELLEWAGVPEHGPDE